MIDIKGCGREASSFLVDVYADGTFIITELYSVLEMAFFPPPSQISSRGRACGAADDATEVDQEGSWALAIQGQLFRINHLPAPCSQW